MKKQISLILILALILTLVSCGENMEHTTPSGTTDAAVTPPTETLYPIHTTLAEHNCTTTRPETTTETVALPIVGKTAFRTYEIQNNDGIHMSVLVHGYETQDDAFFALSNEFLMIDVKVTNTSEKTVSQWLSTMCHKSEHASDHELSISLSDGNGHSLCPSTFGYACPTAIEIWSLAPGEKIEWTLSLAAGKQVSGNGDFDIPMPYGKSRGINLYEEDIYTGGICEFFGDISFSYYFEGEKENSRTISVPLRQEIRYSAFSKQPTPPETTILPPTTTEPIEFTEKPIIYLYPEKETEVFVKLDYKGEFVCTYPIYNDGWHVLAQPDGTLTNLADGKEYSYLFWDGIDDARYDLSRGYCVKGEDTAAFLQEILAKMGLTPREYNEFIVYWFPKMQNNPYNLITFQEEAYTDIAPLTVSPSPDSMLRVFMVYQPLDAYIEVEAPEIKPFERNGFTVIEWGGKQQ